MMEIHLSCGATKNNGDVWIPDKYLFGEKKIQAVGCQTSVK